MQISRTKCVRAHLAHWTKPSSGLALYIFSSPARLRSPFLSAYAWCRRAAKLKMLRIMGLSHLVVLAILISHQRLLHTIQPLPPSPSCISSVSGPADCREFLSDATASHHCQRNYETAGSLRSLGITPVHRYFESFRHPSDILLAFLPFPGSTGYRSDLLQSLSLWDEEGFSSCVTLSPCPYHPPERHVASVSARHAMLPSSVGRRFGFRF
jgi:hypothetical protein